jgi:hypothetical protein
MLNRLFVSTLVVGMVASVATAEISISYSPSTIAPDVATDVAVSLVANDDLPATTIGAIIMNYDQPNSDLSELNPTAFSFNAAFSTPDWFLDVSLPDTIQAVWGGTAGAGNPIQSGESVQFATLTLSPGPHDAEAAYLLAADAEIADSSEFAPFEIKGGDPATIVVTPEPASLSLLALGAFAALRRNRR